MKNGMKLKNNYFVDLDQSIVQILINLMYLEFDNIENLDLPKIHDEKYVSTERDFKIKCNDEYFEITAPNMLWNNDENGTYQYYADKDDIIFDFSLVEYFIYANEKYESIDKVLIKKGVKIIDINLIPLIKEEVPRSRIIYENNEYKSYDSDGKICFSFSLYPDIGFAFINLVQVNKCGYDNGTCNLLHIENIAKKISERYVKVKYITLLDYSQLNINDYVFNLSYLHILIHGISWYNKKGYYDDNHLKNYSLNMRFISKPMTEVLENDKIYMLEQYIDQKITNDMTVQDCYEIVSLKLKQGKSEYIEELYVVTQELSKKIIYDFPVLKKYL